MWIVKVMSTYGSGQQSYVTLFFLPGTPGHRYKTPQDYRFTDKREDKLLQKAKCTSKDSLKFSRSLFKQQSRDRERPLR